MVGSGAMQGLPPPVVVNQPPRASTSKWIWWIVGLLALGAVVGALAALVFNKHT
jgi:hypothetical protein